MKGIATISYVLLLLGVLNRRRSKLHRALMSSGMLIDVFLVLTLEFQRAAIGTATGGRLNWMQTSHVVFSFLAVSLYFPVAVLGYYRFQGRLPSRGKDLHRQLGILAFVLRTFGYFLMYSMTGHYR